MTKRLSAQDVSGLQDVMRIGGDLLLLPKVQLPNISEGLALQKAGIIDVESSELARNRLVELSLRAQQEYVQARKTTGKEPGWITDRPIAIQKFMRNSYAVMEEEPLAILNAFPHTGVGYMVVEDGLCDDIARAFNLWRLQDVRQLGFLQAPWLVGNDKVYVMPMGGNRYVHSLDVMAIASLIGHNLKLKKSAFNTLRVAAFTHDFGTPAGGDSVKLVDLAAFDEDENYPRLIQERVDAADWKRICEKYHIDEKVLAETILNKGLLGQILDVADKLAYVARDIDVCLGVADWKLDDGGEGYVGTRALDEILKMHPDVCNIWDSVRQHGDTVVFADPVRLIAFLKTRIVLFRELYYHPRARFGEYLISRLLVKKLYDEKKLTRDELLGMRDTELTSRLEKEYGQLHIIRLLSASSQVRSFATREEAVAFKESLVKQGHVFCLIEDHLNLIKTGTKWLVKTPQGVKPLVEAFPGDGKELYEMANMLPAVHVYYIDGGPSGAEKDLVHFLGKFETAPA